MHSLAILLPKKIIISCLSDFWIERGSLYVYLLNSGSPGCQEVAGLTTLGSPALPQLPSEATTETAPSLAGTSLLLFPD